MARTDDEVNALCRYPGGRVAICGDDDTLLIGADDQWTAAPLPTGQRDYTGIAAEGETLYLAHGGGIDVYAAGKLKRLKIARRVRNDLVVLRSGPDGVWSFAGRCVGRIAGGTWQVLA